MSIDWTHLNARTSGYAITQVTKDPTDAVDGILCVGLHVRMSDLVSQFPEGGGSTLTVFADTLVMDVDAMAAKGTVIVARVVDLTAMDGGARAITVPAPQSGTTAVEVLVGSVNGGTLQLASPGGAEPFAVPVGLDPLQAATYFVDADGSVNGQVRSSADDIGDLTGRIYALNSFRASFSAGAWLMNSDAPAARDTAQDMFAWVMAGTALSAQQTATEPAAWSELNGQAAPLLVELNVESGATYVPTLSSRFYKSEVSLLLDALDSYDAKVDGLKRAKDQKQAVEDVATAYAEVAKTELEPLDEQLKNLRQNLAGLTNGINTLNMQFQMQSDTVRVKYGDLLVALSEAKIKAWFEACFSLSISAVKIGFDGASLAAGAVKKSEAPGEEESPDTEDDDDDVLIPDWFFAEEGEGDDEPKKPKKKKNGDPGLGPAKGIITEGIGAAVKAFEAIKAVTEDVGAAEKPLLEKAQALVDQQQKLIQSYAVSTGHAKDLGLSSAPSLETVDPALAWDNYMAEATVRLKNVGAAGDFLVSLIALANYGKALAAKIVTATTQQTQLQIVTSQREAAVQASARWKELEAKAVDDQERLCALVGVLEGRSDAIRRSVYIAWRHYGDAYYYLNLERPPISVDLDTSPAALRTALAKTALWVGQAQGDDPSGKQILLPVDDARISFEFDIRARDSQEIPPHAALYTPAQGKKPPTLTWTIPMGSDQLVNVLPNRGNLPIWIKEARFFVDGATPNNKGNIMVDVWTSGSYENGYGPADAESFVAKAIVSSFAYEAASGRPYIPWSVKTDVYMTPTPYTQWTMVFDRDGGDAADASKLRMDLIVSFKEPS